MADKIDKATEKEIERLGKKYKKKEDQMLLAGEELRRFVWDIMDKQNMWDNMEDILDMIYRIPKSYASFMLWERYHELKKAQEASD